MCRPDRRVFFVPFSGTNGIEFKEKCKNWERAYTSKKKGMFVSTVQYNGRSCIAVRMLQAPTDVIYSRGHGSPGWGSVRSHHGGEDLSYEDVCDRIIRSGLKKSFPGKIKFYS